MKRSLLIGFLVLGALSLNSCGDSSPNACAMSEDFIKRDLNYPNSADFNFLDCNSTNDGNGEYTVLRKITAKNAFGVSKDYIYKVVLKYKGGVAVDNNNWEVVSMRKEEYRN